MLTEISLNILDIALNSTKAEATLVEIDVRVDETSDSLYVSIKDNGYGMSKEQVERVIDPFYTTRTTRSVGLGVPFFKLAAEATGGDFEISSVKNEGTIIKTRFVLSHIDRMPLGDVAGSIHSLIVYHPTIDFVFRYAFNQASFVLDTREFREVLGDVPFDVPDVSNYIMEFLIENKKEVDGGKVY